MLEVIAHQHMLPACCWSCRGKLRRQNEKAHLIGHVKDVGVDSKHDNPATRIYLTSVAQPWHVDGVDAVGECSNSLLGMWIHSLAKPEDTHFWLSQVYDAHVLHPAHYS